MVCITIIQPGMGFKTLSFFSPVSGGPPERPVALTCVAQTGVVSPGGDEQATRYYPPSLIRGGVAKKRTQKKEDELNCKKK